MPSFHHCHFIHNISYANCDNIIMLPFFAYQILNSNWYQLFNFTSLFICTKIYIITTRIRGTFSIQFVMFTEREITKFLRLYFSGFSFLSSLRVEKRFRLLSIAIWTHESTTSHVSQLIKRSLYFWMDKTFRCVTLWRFGEWIFPGINYIIYIVLYVIL